MTPLRVLSTIAFAADLSGCIVPSADATLPSNDDAATPDAALATDLTDASPQAVDAGTHVVSCESILDPEARAACGACLANPPIGDGGSETCEHVDVASGLGPTTCCVLHSSDEAGNGSCQAIFTYYRMAFVGACPPAQ